MFKLKKLIKLDKIKCEHKYVYAELVNPVDEFGYLGYLFICKKSGHEYVLYAETIQKDIKEARSAEKKNKIMGNQIGNNYHEINVLGKGWTGYMCYKYTGNAVYQVWQKYLAMGIDLDELPRKSHCKFA